MANSKRNYHDEDTHRFNDCVEGDTVSEGDTSDDEDIEACKNKNSTRRTSSQRKEGLELPSGSADGSRCFRGRRRKLLCCVAFTIVAAAIGGGIYAAVKFTGSSSPSTILEEDFASSSSTTVDIAPTEQDENDSIPNSEDVDAIPTAEEDENDSMLNPEDTSVVPSTEEEENDGNPSITEDENESPSDSFGIHKGDNIAVLDEFMDHQGKTEESTTEEEAQATEWPSLVGKTGEEAKAELELLYGEGTYDIYVLNENNPTTRDYRFNRIRIFTNNEGVVTQVPRIG